LLRKEKKKIKKICLGGAKRSPKLQIYPAGMPKISGNQYLFEIIIGLFHNLCSSFVFITLLLLLPKD